MTERLKNYNGETASGFALLACRFTIQGIGYGFLVDTFGMCKESNTYFHSGESRKFFLPVLCMPEAHNSGGSKIIFLWLLIKKGKWVLDIH